MGDKMNKSLGVMEVDLDGRFSMVRTQETNLGWSHFKNYCVMPTITF